MPTPYVRHVSVRVPWQDAVWNGHVCDDPLANSSCLALRLIAENRDDEVEQGLAKEAFDGLSPEQMPPCLRSSAAFLSPHSYTFKSVMEYSKWSRDHKHILPRSVHLPAFGALLIPYRWMLKESGFQIAESLELDAHAEREPNRPSWLVNTSWVQHQDNQRTLLDAFAKPLLEDETLVFFYAPRTPLCDDERRALLGVALLQKKSDLVEYPYEGGNPNGRLQAMVWERPIQHSLRPRRKAGTGFSGGFVMPYHEVLALAELDRTVDPAEFVAFVPNDVRVQFSYGSEHVSHGVAATVLTASRNALEKIGTKLDGPWTSYITWIDERLSRLWRLQGPAPGLGVTLSALHKGFNGTLFAVALSDVLGENEDPWPLVDRVLSGVQDAPPGAPKITTALRRRWANVKTDPKRLASLKLLARFELTNDQADRAVNDSEPAGVLSNPYVLYEDDRKSVDRVPFATIDRGLYPGAEIAAAHPLPAECDRSLDEPDNPLRLRAACVHILEEAAAQGDTILPADRVKDASEKLTLSRPLPLDGEMLDIFRDDFRPVIQVAGNKTKPTAQLERYVQYRELIEQAVKSRLTSKPKRVAVDWKASLNRKFGKPRPGDVDELRARQEKEVALDRLAASRIAALVGPAGTGKTTVLELLLQQDAVVGTRVHLLAPTGKARVRLAQETNRPGEGETIAQFLLALERYDKVTGRYFPNPAAAKAEATTCIVDESSMMTEDMLAAIVDAIPDSCRLVLVGDPYQLPPIGAGCPFVDIIEFLRHNHAEAIGELTVPRRQDTSSQDGRRTTPLERSDVELAAIFSGRALLPGEDEIAARILTSADDEFVKCRRWDQTAELPSLLRTIFKKEFSANDDTLQSKFEEFLGAVTNQKGYLNFENGCSDGASDWQILCVTKTQPGGSIHLNRHIKETYRSERLEKAIESNHVPHFRDWFRFIKPRGPEQITYGDKVICVRNHFRGPWIYAERTRGPEDEYIANGETGMVVGQCAYGKSNPRFTHVEFSGRPDRSFSFGAGAFREEGQPYLELAYAITVHKAQGSDFDIVILVLPMQSRLLSREMLYTALTRQKRRIWILHQGPLDTVLAYRHYSFSDIAARFTNLLREHRPQQVPNPVGLPSGLLSLSRGFLEERLVHRTVRGEMVSSKSELAIANILYLLEREGHLTYVVEPPLPFADNAKGRWADFQIKCRGGTWYWEHCGMMDHESYRQRWTRKERLYQENGFTRYSDENPSGHLIVTEDGPGQGLDSQAIALLARKLFVSAD